MVGERLRVITPSVAHFLRHPRQRAVHAVLHQHLGRVRVGADLEGHRQPHLAVAAALGRHVEHVLHAVDLLLERRGHGVGDGLRAGAGIVGDDEDGRRRDLGILGDRQREQRNRAQQHDQDGQHRREDRPADEEVGEFHGRVPVRFAAWLPASVRCRGRPLARRFGLRTSASDFASCTSTFDARPQHHQAVDDHPVLRRQALEHRAQRAVGPAGLDVPRFSTLSSRWRHRRICSPGPTGRPRRGSAAPARGGPARTRRLANMPGTRVRSAFSKTARSRMVPVCGLTWLSKKSSRPRCAKPCSLTSASSQGRAPPLASASFA